MYTNYLEKLEFNEIIKMVNNFCVTNQGKKLAPRLVPRSQIDEVTKLLQETRRSC